MEWIIFALEEVSHPKLRVMVGSQKHCSSFAVVVFGRNPVPSSVTLPRYLILESDPVSNHLLSVYT